MDVRDLLKVEKMSKKDKTMLVIFIIGVIVLGLILFSNYKNSKTGTVKTINKVQKSGIPAAAITKKDTEEKKKIDPSDMEELIRGVGREDPFLPSERKTYMRSKYGLGFRLEGITIDSDGRPMAIINDEIVGVGDMIADGEVVKIEKEKVTVKIGKKEYNLRLWSDQAIKEGGK